MHVAPQPILIAPHHERDLAVHLVVHDAVDDVHARFLEPPRPEDVVRLVEARLQLGHRGDLLAILHRVHQRADDARVAAGAVERLLDGEHIGIAAPPARGNRRRCRSSRRDDAPARRAGG